MSQELFELKTISKIASQIGEAFSLDDPKMVDKLPTNIPTVGVVKYLKDRSSGWKVVKLNPGSEATEITPLALALFVNRKLFEYKVTEAITVEQFIEEKANLERVEGAFRLRMHDETEKLETVRRELDHVAEEYESRSKRDEAFLNAFLDGIKKNEEGGVSLIQLAVSIFGSGALNGLFIWLIYMKRDVVPFAAVIMAIISTFGISAAFSLFLDNMSSKAVKRIKQSIEEYFKKD